jgi:outer membrane murein-binding lipoprotein Lpp
MIRRLALVIWWLAAIALAVGVWSGCARLITQHRCTSVFAELAAWQEKTDRASENAERATKQAVASARNAAAEANRKFDDFDALSVEVQFDAEKMFPKPTMRAGLDEEARHCEMNTAAGDWTRVALEGAFAVGLFAISYILSGSFWRPPKVT